jgi:Protein of unknown function (DUF1387)
VPVPFFLNDVYCVVGREAAQPTGHLPASHEPPHASTRKIAMSLDKTFKDLHRQTVSLERLKLVLGDNIDKSFKRVAEVFKELHQEYVSWLPIFCYLSTVLSSSDRFRANVLYSVQITYLFKAAGLIE